MGADDRSDTSDAWFQLSRAANIPALGDDQILVRTTHVALNAYDWASSGHANHVIGRDGVGSVIAIGKAVRRLQVGQRVSLGLPYISNIIGTDTFRFGSARTQLFTAVEHSKIIRFTTPPKSGSSLRICWIRTRQHWAPGSSLPLSLFLALSASHSLGQQIPIFPQSNPLGS
jgi:hypothetical protein